MTKEEYQKLTKPVRDVFNGSVSLKSVLIGTCDANKKSEEQSDFEAAIEATEYGPFNYLLLLAIFPGAWAHIFDTTIMSYLLPSVKCDLELTLNQKGMLNAVIFLGMLCTAFLWGFLADVKGRKSLLLIGYSADTILNILSSMSQNFYTMLCFKFLCGLMISGTRAIKMTYLAEFHSTKYRAATLYWSSLFSALGNVILPVLAWAIIPQTWSVTLFSGAFVYNSWRIFVFVCSMPALLAFIGLLYFPESPKFLMAQGKNEQALKIFRKMYALNTGNPPEMYPIKFLIQDTSEMPVESSEGNSTVWEKTRQVLTRVKPLFSKPLCARFFMITILEFGSILSLITIRMWMPQLFTMIETYDFDRHDPSRGAVTVCEMISVRSVTNVTIATGLNHTAVETCLVPPIPIKVYANSMIISISTVLGFVFAGTLVNLIGKKRLLLTTYAVATACTIALNWSSDSKLTLGIIAVYITLMDISVTTIITYMVCLMPTSLRTMSVTLSSTISCFGPIIGNVLFPILLTKSCLGPFFFIAMILMSGFVLTLFVPTPPPKLL